MIYLLIEFLDELVYGVTQSAWPLIRADLALDYIQIGLALSLPGVISSIIEPFLGILGDVWKRRVLILGGGAFFILALILTGSSWTFGLLLFSFILIYPSSGAFVSLSQATLMDSDPARREQNMARWTFAGSLGVVIGPLLLGGMAYIGFGWRGVFIALAVTAAIILLVAWRWIPKSAPHLADLPSLVDLLAGIRAALRALRTPHILRWLILLEFSDLMLDVLYGYLALYFVDVALMTPVQAALSVAVWTGFGLLGDFLLIPLLEKVRGLDYLRLSVIIELLLFPAFLLLPQPWLKLAILALLGLFNSGWYAILQGNLYKAMPGRSGAVITLGNIVGLVGDILPFTIGLAAYYFGLHIAMWLLLLGPLALLIGLPSRRRDFATRKPR